MTKTTKITKRDRYNELITVLNGAMLNETAKQDLIEFCEAQIAQLDKKSDKAKEAAAAKKTETDPMTVAIQGVLTGEFATISDITDKVDVVDATEAKVRYRLNALVDAGVAEKTQVSIPGVEGAKARKLQAYRIVD